MECRDCHTNYTEEDVEDKIVKPCIYCGKCFVGECIYISTICNCKMVNKKT